MSEVKKYTLTEIEIVDNTIQIIESAIATHKFIIERSLKLLSETFEHHLSSQAEMGFKASVMVAELEGVLNKIEEIKLSNYNIVNKTSNVLHQKKKEMEAILINGTQVVNSSNGISELMHGWRRETYYILMNVAGGFCDQVEYSKQNYLAN
jgi:adenylosuccinate synthase